MDKSKIAELKEIAEGFALPSYEEIPDVGLFLEQVARYVAKYAESAGLAPLTGSMISNYVKKKIIKNPVKKMYDREQIAYLIFIVFAKNVIQIEDMQKLFEIQRDVYGIKESYEYFRSQMREYILKVFGVDTEEKKSGKKLGEEDDIFDQKSILKNICITVAHKIYLERCFRLYSEE